jgi:hypothetical protein
VSTALSAEKAERVAALDNGHWSVWLAACFPQVFTKPMAWFQIEAWDLIWQCTAGAAPSPPSLIMSAFRGSSKSGTAEAAVVALLATQRRKYCVYVSGTQDSANDRVGSISDLAIGSEMLGAWHPEMASAFLEDKARQSRWNSKRIEFGNGTVVDAAGLDTKARGKKSGEQRPDLIILDDIDEPSDSARVRNRKLMRLRGILGGGAPGGGTLVLFVQNRIYDDSIQSQVIDRRIGMLADRLVIGPVPMVRNATYRPDPTTPGRTLISGTPSWPEVWPLEACQAEMDRLDVMPFRRENQDDLHLDVPGALLKSEHIIHEPVTLAQLSKTIVAVDPATTSKPGSDETGIVGVGRHVDGRWVVLEDRTKQWPVSEWPTEVDALAVELRASEVILEGNNGGELNVAAVEAAQRERLRPLTDRLKLVLSLIGEAGLSSDLAAERDWLQAELAAAHRYRVRLVHASEPKAVRAGRPAARYQTHEVIHAKPLPKLEARWTGWVPGVSRDSPGDLDACVHGLIDLGCIPRAPAATAFSTVGADRTF